MIAPTGTRFRLNQLKFFAASRMTKMQKPVAFRLVHKS